MNDIKKVGIILVVALMLLNIKVFASSVNLSMTGSEEVEPGKTSKINLILSSEQDIGVMSGILEYNDYIKSIQVDGRNGWQITYNKATGDFFALKAEGAKSEEIAEITYTVKENVAGNATVTLKNTSFSTTTYQTMSGTDISKEILIKEKTEKILNEIKITTMPNKLNYEEGEVFNTDGMVVTAKYSDGTQADVTNYTYIPSEKLGTTNDKIIISYTEGEITKTAYCSITVEEKKDVDNNTNNNSTSNNVVDNEDTNNVTNNMIDNENTSDVTNNVVDNENTDDVINNEDDSQKETDVKQNIATDGSLPQTGISNYIVIITIISLGLVASIFTIKYKQYKNV